MRRLVFKKIRTEINWGVGNRGRQGRGGGGSGLRHSHASVLVPNYRTEASTGDV